MKLVANAMLAACNAAAAELLAAARRQGLDPESAFRLLTRTVPYLQVRRRGYLEGDHGRPIFNVNSMVKDLDLALGLGHAAGAAMPALAQVRELFGLAALEHGEDEISAVIEVYGR